MPRRIHEREPRTLMTAVLRRTVLGWCLAPALALVVLVAGCATVPLVDWSARVGTFTFDQAVNEMGPPDKSATLTGGALVAEWLTQRGHAHTVIQTVPGYSYQRVDVLAAKDRFLRLTFGADGVLSEWKPVWR